MTDNDEASRAAFEAAIKPFTGNVARWKGDAPSASGMQPGEYMSLTTHVAWQAWKARGAMVSEDSARLDFLMDIILNPSDSAAQDDPRCAALAGALGLSTNGREVIDAARKATGEADG